MYMYVGLGLFFKGYLQSVSLPYIHNDECTNYLACLKLYNQHVVLYQVVYSFGADHIIHVEVQSCRINWSVYLQASLRYR